MNAFPSHLEGKNLVISDAEVTLCQKILNKFLVFWAHL